MITLISKLLVMVFQGHSSWRTCSPSAASRSSHSAACSETVGHFERLVQCGSLREDAQQRHVLQQLVQLQDKLKTYSNSVYLNPPRLNLEDDDSSQNDKGHRISTAEEKAGEPGEKVIMMCWLPPNGRYSFSKVVL